MHIFKTGVKLNKDCFCQDCKKKLSNTAFYTGTKRCHSCANRIISQGRKHTPEEIIKIRNSLVALNRTGLNNPMFGKKPAYAKRVKYGNYFFRSSWEVAYAKYLDKNNVAWLYEPKIFNLGIMCYVPDFYLPATDTYIEIKGYWRENSKAKFYLFKNKFPEIKIILLREFELKQLEII